MKDGDSFTVVSSATIKSISVSIVGEVSYPGVYNIRSGETVLDLINKSGGMSEQAYPEAAVFTRTLVAEQQKSSFNKNADNLEKSLVDAVSSGSEIDGEAYTAISAFIERLREIEPIGRQVVSIDPYTSKQRP